MASAGPLAAPPVTPGPPPTRWWVDAVWLVLLAVWTAAYCLSSSPRVGITYDEPIYLDGGLAAWRGWDRDGRTSRYWHHEHTTTNGVMPLPPDVATIPLYVFERRTGEKLDSQGKLDRVRWARAMTLGWVWLLVLSGWRLGRAAGGPWAGRIAAGLLAVDPNFLAHGALATTDVAASATLLAFTRAVYAGRGGGWWKRIVLPGLWFGVAVSAKLSALVYGGLVLVLLEACHWVASGALVRPAGGPGVWARKVGGVVLRSALAALGVVLIGIALATAYCGIPDPGQEPFVKVANAVPGDEPLKERYMRWANGAGRVPYAVCAFAFQWWWNDSGRSTYLNGTFYKYGYRYYFPELLIMKLPVPVFLLAAAVALRPRAAAGAVLLTGAVLLAALLTANLQIGFRLALPAVGVFYTGLAIALARGYGARAVWLAGPAVLAMAATSAWVWPHGLCYLNQLRGGLEAAPYRVSDSNCDWGQGIPELKRWHAANGEPDIWVWYFGTDSAVRRPPFSHFEPPATVASGPDLCRAVGPRLLAVGYTVLTLHPDGTPQKIASLEYLRTRRPLARTPTFVIYDFRNGEPPPLD